MPVVITGNNTPTAGGITYGDGTTYAVTAAGTSGRPVVSGGAGAPTFRPYTLPAADGSASQVLQTNGSGALSFATVGGGFSQAQIFTGSGSFTVPASGKFKVTIIGGGGSGACSSSITVGPGSGAGGGTVIKWFTGATPSATATVTIGAGGAGKATAGAGNAGGNSTFVLSGFNTLTASGGAGGLTAGGGSSAGGAAADGDINSPGQNGSSNVLANNNASNSQVGFAGSTLLGFGRVEMENFNDTGTAGVLGAGSCGRYNTNTTGAGGDGICIVEF
jgi:hypothetical protein